MKIRTVIVEDSRLARNELKELMKEQDCFELIGEAENVDDGVALIEQKMPDLLFLDIDMPEKDGFELLQMLNYVPLTVFTTAFDQYAIKSFEYNAMDYLLKPIGTKRFAQAIEKVKKQLENNIPKEKMSTDDSDVNRQIFIKDGEKCWIVRVKEITLFEIVGNYTRAYFNENNALIYKSLNQVELKLSEKSFFRVNRQQIINLEHIQKVTPWFNGKLKITLKNNSSVEVSRRQSYVFKELLSI